MSEETATRIWKGSAAALAVGVFLAYHLGGDRVEIPLFAAALAFGASTLLLAYGTFTDDDDERDAEAATETEAETEAATDGEAEPDPETGPQPARQPSLPSLSRSMSTDGANRRLEGAQIVTADGSFTVLDVVSRDPGGRRVKVMAVDDATGVSTILVELCEDGRVVQVAVAGQPWVPAWVAHHDKPGSSRDI